MCFIFFRGTYFAKKDDKGVSYYFRYLYVSDLSLFHFRKILLLGTTISKSTRHNEDGVMKK